MGGLEYEFAKANSTVPPSVSSTFITLLSVALTGNVSQISSSYIMVSTKPGRKPSLSMPANAAGAISI